MTRTFFRAVIDSPIQPLALAFDEAGALRALSFDGPSSRSGGDALRATMAREYPGAALVEAPVPEAMTTAFDAYFAGDRSALDRIVWSLDGATGQGGFQARVWEALTQIPAGQTISYGEMARRAGGSGPAGNFSLPEPIKKLIASIPGMPKADTSDSAPAGPG